MSDVGDQAIKTHLQRASEFRPQQGPLLTPEQEYELEQDLVREDRWQGVTILPAHRAKECR